VLTKLGRWFALAALPLLLGCPGSDHSRPPRAQGWYERALDEFGRCDIDAAHDSVRHALDMVPRDTEVRLLGARVALARLEYDEVTRLLRGLPGSEASGLRGRALWYKGDLEGAANELDRLLADPEVKDAWAKSISKLARTGVGRKPFDVTTTDGNLSVVQMVRVAPTTPLYIVPVEIDGDKALALVATGTAEVTVDAATRPEPSWVSLRFGDRLEVKDVPALTQDLSGLSREMGAPIKALLGANILRHLNVTMDFHGRQFVVRAFTPPPPPVASRLDVYYLRGGGMVLGSAMGDERASTAAFFVDTSMGHHAVLDEGGWRKLGINVRSLPRLDGVGGSKLRSGSIPLLQLGAFKLPQIPAIYGLPIARVERELSTNVDGALGAGLLSGFRLTFADEGRILWIEHAPTVPKEPGLEEPGGLKPPQSEPGLTPPGEGGLGPLIPSPLDPSKPRDNDPGSGAPDEP
jgi:hypothetical protein